MKSSVENEKKNQLYTSPVQREVIFFHICCFYLMLSSLYKKKKKKKSVVILFCMFTMYCRYLMHVQVSGIFPNGYDTDMEYQVNICW
jgi:hypothetical protein